MLAVCVTFAISGLWHGAAWTFVVWGALHGVGVSFELMTRRWRTKRLKFSGHRVERGSHHAHVRVRLLHVHFLSGAIVDGRRLFRATVPAGIASLFAAAVHPSRIAGTFSALSLARADTLIAVTATALMFWLEHVHARRVSMNVLLARYPRRVRWAAYYVVVFAIIFAGAQNSGRQFIYFQF